MQRKPTKKIPLTKGQFAIIDEDIFEVIKHMKWQAHKEVRTFYAQSEYKGQGIKLHHVVMGKPLYGKEIDHIDGNGLNNLRSNLRIVTRRENASNRWFHREGGKTSKFMGVSWYKAGKKWRATIGFNGKHKSLGYFDTQEEASKAYQDALAGGSSSLLPPKTD